jgi:mRNA interferase MazF
MNAAILNTTNYTNNQKIEILRGDILLVDFGEGKDNIQGGIRPAIAVSNWRCNMHSPVIHVVPITSAKKPLPTHVNIPTIYGVDRDSIALCEQQQLINKKVIKGKLGHCDSEIMSYIDNALKIQLGLQDKIENTNYDKQPERKQSNYPIPNRGIQQEAFDFTKAKRISRTINELERRLNEYKSMNKEIDLFELKTDIKAYKHELEDYCKKFNKDYTRFYTPIEETLSGGSERFVRAI